MLQEVKLDFFLLATKFAFNLNIVLYFGIKV